MTFHSLTPSGRSNDSGVSDWRTNPGGSANRYLRDFKRVTVIDAGSQIAEAIHGGAEVHIGKGFHDRNSTVADADAIIALTFGHGPVPPDEPKARQGQVVVCHICDGAARKR